MASTEQRSSERILAERRRFVSNGVSTPRLVVTSADGARVTDADGRVFLDFAGGIGCQNTGHRFAPVVEAIQQQADRYLHQCFMVGVYEPYVDTCRLLAELSPCAGADQKSILVNSGAEANENAVKIARAATGRPAVVVFDNAFHGRTLLTMTMTSKVHPYKAGFGPFAPEVYRAPAPYPYRGVSSDDALDGLRKLFKSEVDPQTVACVLLEPVQGEGGFVADAAGLPRPASPSSAASTGSCTSTTRSSPASAGPGRCGRSSTTTASSRTCSSPGSRSAAACPSPPSPAAPS